MRQMLLHTTCARRQVVVASAARKPADGSHDKPSNPRTIKRGAGGLSPSENEQLRSQLESAGMSPAAMQNLLNRGQSSDLRRPEHILAVWAVLRDHLGSKAANQVLQRSTGACLLQFSPASLPPKLGALQRELGGLQHEALAALVARAPDALNAPVDDLSARIGRYARLLGCSKEEAVAWVVREPSVLSNSLADPEARLAELADSFEASTEAVQAMLLRVPNLLTRSPQSMRRKMEVLPAALGVIREALMETVRVSPSLLTTPLESLEPRRRALEALAAQLTA